MTFLLILLILIGLGLWGAQEYYQIKLGIKPTTTPPGVMAALADIMHDVGENGTFLDMGSGYGSLVLNLAKRAPEWHIVGLELSPTPWIISQMRSIGKNFGNYSFFLGDAHTWNLRNYDMIFINQNKRIVAQWETGLARRLLPGTLLVILNNKLPRIHTSSSIAVDDRNTLYLYRKPEPVPAEPVVEMAVNELPPEQAGPEFKVQSEDQLDFDLEAPMQPSHGDNESGD